MINQSQSGSERVQEQQLAKALSTIERVGNRLDLDVAAINLAKSTYKQHRKACDTPLDDMETDVMAALYLGARLNSNPITPEEIIEVDPVTTTRNAVLRRSKEIISALPLGFRGFYDINSSVDRICNNLGLHESFSSRAKEIVDRSKERGIASGKTPAAVAAAAVYNAALEDSTVTLTQEEIAREADVTKVTIRSRYQEQREVLK